MITNNLLCSAGTFVIDELFDDKMRGQKSEERLVLHTAAGESFEPTLYYVINNHALSRYRSNCERFRGISHPNTVYVSDEVHGGRL